jgi:molybdopterin biosynthesis enzyme
MSGSTNYSPKFMDGFLTKDFHKKGNRRQFVLIKAAEKNTGYSVSPVTSHGSADILSLSASDGAMMLGEKITLAKTKSRQKFILW